MGGKDYRNSKLKREKAKKDAHNQGLKRPANPSLEREEPKLFEHGKILIVCEGKYTEVDYFNEFKKFFKLSNITLRIVGTGYNTLSLVEKTEVLAQKDNYDEIWCVFDKDDFSNQNFNNAILKAKSLDFKVAYSNQSFEFWLLLHFVEHSGSALDRKYYYRLLKPHLQGYSKKNKHLTTKHFEILQVIEDPKTGKSRQDLAIERAKRIMKKCEEEDPSRSNPSQEESSTTVFKLVEELMSYQKK